MADDFPIRVDRNVYPRPEHRYPNAKISTTYADSAADFPPPQEAPGGAPNILLVLLDDVGFGWPSVFGGLVEMPTAERLAGDGLVYNRSLAPRPHNSPEVGALRVVARPSKCAGSRCDPNRCQLDSLGLGVHFGGIVLKPGETPVESGAQIAKL